MIKYTGLVVVSIFIILSCKKNRDEEVIPYVPVNITISLNLPQYSVLNSIGNHVDINGGYKGIVVYRRSLDEFVAYDRACSFDPTTAGSILTVDSSGSFTKDSKCNSKFNLYDGSIVNGPATRPMKAYRVDYNSQSATIFIYN